MDFEDSEIGDLADILEMLLDDLPAKIRDELEVVIENLGSATGIEDLLKIQDELESISNMNNLDSFSRNEIMNVIASIELIVNS